MNIAILGSRGIPANYSGIEEAVEQIAKRLAQRGHKLIVYCRRANMEKENGLHRNIKLIFLPTINNKYLGTIIHVFLSTIDVLFRKVDIVHFNALGPSIFSLLPRIFLKKTVVTIHGLDWQRKKWEPLAQRFLRFCEYSSIYFPNITIVVSKTLKNYFEKKYKKEVYYLPNGVVFPKDSTSLGEPDDYWFDGLKINEYILFVGRLVPEKNIGLLISAFIEIKTNMKLVIAGLTDYNNTYLKYLKRISNSNIKFFPFIKGRLLDRLYRGAYLFVLPSDIEGLALSLLEAMSYGKCVLTSDIPESLEAIEDAGFFFKLNSKEDLKKKLKMLIGNPNLTTEYGLKARVLAAKKYNLLPIIDKIENIYFSLLKK